MPLLYLHTPNGEMPSVDKRFTTLIRFGKPLRSPSQQPQTLRVPPVFRIHFCASRRFLCQVSKSIQSLKLDALVSSPRGPAPADRWRWRISITNLTPATRIWCGLPSWCRMDHLAAYVPAPGNPLPVSREKSCRCARSFSSRCISFLFALLALLLDFFLFWIV